MTPEGARPIRVVHYVDSAIYGGSEEAALHLMGALDRERWEPVLMHHLGAGIARLVSDTSRLGIRTLAVPTVDPRHRLAGMARLWQALRSERPAILHAHLSWPYACKHGVRAAWLARVPVMVGTAQLYVTPDRRRQPLMLQLFRRIIAVSEHVKIRYAQELGVPRQRLVVVPNAIKVPPACRPGNPALRAALVGTRPDYVILTPARLAPEKGHRFLLAAAAQVPDATFLLAGEGPLRGQLEGLARELGIADRCVFLGQRSDVADLLALSDLFVLPSLSEGLPLSVLEAMAAQRPVIATRIGGTDEAVEHEVTGLLVPPSDAAALARAIQRVRSEPILANRLAVAGRQRVESEFSSSVAAHRVMQVYDELMKEIGRAGHNHR
jgi:glycosyltransferase involved in cell wall biosynthesis